MAELSLCAAINASALQRTASLGLLTGIALLHSACTGLEPAAISAGASAAQTGATFITQGKLTKFEAVTFDDAVAAMRAAASRLSLKLVSDSSGPADPSPSQSDSTAPLTQRTPNPSSPDGAWGSSGARGALESAATRQASASDAGEDETTPATSAERRVRMVYQDDFGESMVIVVQRRTLTLTRVQVDVGTFGAIGVANLVLSECLEALKVADAYDRAAQQSIDEPNSVE